MLWRSWWGLRMSLMGVISLNLAGLAGNVNEGGQVHIAPGMDVGDAAYLIAQHYPGGGAALAVRMGMNQGTLLNKLNPNIHTHHLTLKEAVNLQVAANNPSILYAMAQQLGYTCGKALPAQDGGDPVEAFMHLQAKFAAFTASAADALHGKETVSRNEVRRATDMANDLIAATGAMVAALAARVPQPSNTEG